MQNHHKMKETIIQYNKRKKGWGWGKVGLEESGNRIHTCTVIPIFTCFSCTSGGDTAAEPVHSEREGRGVGAEESAENSQHPLTTEVPMDGG